MGASHDSAARRAASTGTGIDTLPEGIECSICLMDLNKTAEDGFELPPGAEKPWVFGCANHHVFHSSRFCLVASSSPEAASGGARIGRLEVNGMSSSESPGADP